jgi:CRP-like cAMP-binding protein
VKHDDKVTAALSKVSLFEGLEPRALRSIADQTKSFTFEPGDSVIDADASGRFGRLYIVASGTADAVVGDEVVASFGPGDYFGEMSVLDGHPRSASVIATSDLETHGLAAWNMRALLREEPDIALHIIQTLAGRLRAKSETKYE